MNEACYACHEALEARARRCAHCGNALLAGRFVTEAVLASTAASRLYRAHDDTGATVALKELLFTQVPAMAHVEAFEREGRMLEQLDHPAIPRFVASFHEGAGVGLRMYLAQELVEGESLASRMAHHRFSEGELLDLGRQVLEVLVALQSRVPPVFHRDVKPDNLLLRPDGRVALVDFGAAREHGPTVGGTIVGTFGYMPVEQLGGIVNASSDVFALGATLLHLAMRKEPWQCDGWEDDANVPPRLKAFLARALAPASTRLSDAASALVALDEARTGRLAHPRAERKRLLLLGGLAAVSASAAMAFVMLRPSSPPRIPAAHMPEPAPTSGAVTLERISDDDPDGQPLPGQTSRVNKAQLVAAGPSEAFVHVEYDYRGEVGAQAVVCAMALGVGPSYNQFACSPMQVGKGRGFASLRITLAEGPTSTLHSKTVRIDWWGADGKQFARDLFVLERDWQRR